MSKKNNNEILVKNRIGAKDLKYILKIMGLLFVGLTIAILVYPILHELGHFIAILLVRGVIADFYMFPLPNVLCNINCEDVVGITVIGLSGMLMPFFISTITHFKWFWTWYANFVLQGICALSFLLSIISTIKYIAGSPILNDDITQILTFWPEGVWFCLIILILLTGFEVYRFVKERPLKKFIYYFEICDKNTASVV